MRLERLEAISAPSARVVVVVGHSDAEHEAEIEAVKARGAATSATCSFASGGFSIRRHKKEHAMKSSSKTRLQKLETFHGSRDRRLFVIRSDTAAKRDRYVKTLIASGQAADTDLFIDTGVPRAEGFGDD